ncbi:flippase-like domain-containing protein [Hwanghaeella grinnelliae]|uniref:Flippase-like domain-containing protein n=1 Tax=Hwanghaeella grinnelliae TaxID=2500179 RepID=A0A3S2VT12_9PROT|nr:lysylphosphatidylglycerol synthase transmembrane domain-containing protein [Hwanghaeella grinnelliae]RVU39153.1 flippase-like domain-containing protein [Hwanghaeella grinnelliae]
MTGLHPRLSFVLKLLVCLLLLGFVWQVAGGPEILIALGGADPVWLAAGFGLILPQTVLSAVRWRLVAARLGVTIGTKAAISEYYIAIFLNQVLPGGVAGDITRVTRHGSALRKSALAHEGTGGRGYGVAAKAVVYERTVGQIAMVALSIPGLALWRAEAAWIAGGILAVLLALAILAPVKGWIGRQIGDFRKAVLKQDVIVRQAMLSGLIAGSYVLVFWCCVRALGISFSAGTALTVLPPALLAMAIPITPAGWGLREAAAVGMWIAAGMQAGDAAAASILYGLVNLAGALPGAAFLAVGPRTGNT